MNKKTKSIIELLGAALALSVLLSALNAYLYGKKQEEAPEQVTLSGIVVCLPHKGPGPHTKECAIGLMTPDGTHYGLDFSGTADTAVSVADRASFTGYLTPPPSDGKYDIAGTLGVVHRSASE